MRALTLILTGLTVLGSGCAHTPPKPTEQAAFRFDTDTFAFNNETKWHYKDGVPGEKPDENTDNEKRYTQRCFVMSRAAMQFRKFARFEPSQPKLKPGELADRLRDLCDLDVWREPLPIAERIVFPGYANLRDLSGAEKDTLQENLGLDWPTYVRIGNLCMIETPSEDHQARTNEELQTWIKSGHPMIIWIYNFPERDINHCIVAYAWKKDGEKFAYSVYDPNINDHPVTIEFDPGTRHFHFSKTFYFPGGRVSVRPVYLSMLQ